MLSWFKVTLGVLVFGVPCLAAPPCGLDGVCQDTLCTNDPDCIPPPPPPKAYSTTAGLKSYAGENPTAPEFFTTQEPGVAREFDWTVPKALETCKSKGTCAANSFPLIVVLHGYTQTKSAARRWITGYNSLNATAGTTSTTLQGYEKKDVFFLYPNGFLQAGNHGWRVPGETTSGGKTFCLDDPTSYVDVQFLSQAVDEVAKNSSYAGLIDLNRIYMMGFSNGAQMTLANLCLKSAKYQGFAAISNALNAKLSTACGNPQDPKIVVGMPNSSGYGIASTSGRTRGLVTINGTADPKVSTADVDATTTLLASLNGGTFSGSLGFFVNWVSETPTNSTVSVKNWTAVAPGSSTFAHYTIVNGNHSVPSFEAQAADAGCLCSHNQDIAAIDVIWDEWNQIAGLNVP